MALVLAGCGTDIRDASEPAPTQRLVTDAQFRDYLLWTDEYLEMWEKHASELHAMSSHIDARYSISELDRVESDPAMLALLEEQESAMRALLAREPLRGRARDAVRRTIEAMTEARLSPDRIEWVAQRDEAALAQTRTLYGDAFVDWMLEREPMILEVYARGVSVESPR